MPVTLSNSYAPVSSGSTSTDAASVVVASGEKIVLVAYLPEGTLGETVDWGADTDVGDLVGRSAVSGFETVEIWEINSPTADTRTVTLNYDTTGDVGIGVFVFADAGACTDFSTNTTSAANTHTVSVANVTADDFMVDINVSSGNIILGTNQTELFDRVTRQSSSKDGSLATVGEMTWTSGVARNTSAAAVRIPEASAPSGGVAPIFNNYKRRRAA